MMGSGSGEVLLDVVLLLWLFGPLGLSVWLFSRKQDY